MSSSGTADIQLRRSRLRTGLASGAVSIMADRASPRRRPKRAVQARRGLRLFLDVQDLTAVITARFQIDMMRPAKLARVLVLDIGRSRQRVVTSPVAALHARGFSLRNSHVCLILSAAPPNRRAFVAPL